MKKIYFFSCFILVMVSSASSHAECNGKSVLIGESWVPGHAKWKLEMDFNTGRTEGTHTGGSGHVTGQIEHTCSNTGIAWRDVSTSHGDKCYCYGTINGANEVTGNCMCKSSCANNKAESQFQGKLY